MKSKLLWYWRRLSVMPSAEWPHRVRQALIKTRLKRGWRPWSVIEAGSPANGPWMELGLGSAGDWIVGRLNAAMAGWQEVASAARDSPGLHSILGLPPTDLGDPPDWFRDPATGGAWPSDDPAFSINYRHQSCLGEVKYVWEVARMPWLLPRACAAKALGDAGLADVVLRDIEDFVRRNPPLRGIHWTSGIELAWRAITWGLCLDLIRPLVAPSPESRAAIATHLGACAEVCLLLESKYSSANNHLVAEGACLEFVGRLLPGHPRSGMYVATGRRILDAEIPRQILPDGSGAECCPGYLIEVLEWALVVAWTRAMGAENPEASGATAHSHQPLAPDAHHFVPQIWRDRFAAAAEYLSALCQPGDPLPALGDSDDADLLPHPGIAAAAPQRVQKVIKALINGAGQMAKGQKAEEQQADVQQGVVRASCPHGPCQLQNSIDQTDWTDQTDLSPKSPQSSPSNPSSFPTWRIFPDAGQAILRDGPIRAIFECGPFGLPPLFAHAHCDTLSLILDYDGQPVLIDPGTFCYHGQRQWRDWFRSTAAHNTLQIDGLEQARCLGPFMWDRPLRATGPLPLPEGSAVAADHDGFRRAIHHRQVELTAAGVFEVRDWLTARRPPHPSHSTTIRWHFAPGTIAMAGQEAVWTPSSPGPPGPAPDAPAKSSTPWCRVQWHLLPPATESPAHNRASAFPTESADARFHAEIEPGWWSPRFSQKIAAPVLAVRGRLVPGQVLVTRIEIGPRGTTPPKPARNE